MDPSGIEPEPQDCQPRVMPLDHGPLREKQENALLNLRIAQIQQNLYIFYVFKVIEKEKDGKIYYKNLRYCF